MVVLRVVYYYLSPRQVIVATIIVAVVIVEIVAESQNRTRETTLWRVIVRERLI